MAISGRQLFSFFLQTFWQVQTKGKPCISVARKPIKDWASPSNLICTLPSSVRAEQNSKEEAVDEWKQCVSSTHCHLYNIKLWKMRVIKSWHVAKVYLASVADLHFPLVFSFIRLAKDVTIVWNLHLTREMWFFRGMDKKEISSGTDNKVRYDSLSQFQCQSGFLIHYVEDLPDSDRSLPEEDTVCPSTGLRPRGKGVSFPLVLYLSPDPAHFNHRSKN